jgi:hypothetical protein
MRGRKTAPAGERWSARFPRFLTDMATPASRAQKSAASPRFLFGSLFVLLFLFACAPSGWR